MPHSNKTKSVTRIAIAVLASCTGILLMALPTQGQDTSPPPAAPAAASAPAAPPTWSVGGIDFSGLIDGYFTGNFNNPASGLNQLQNFNFYSNQFSLGMAKVTAAHSPDPVGFQLDLGYGKAFDVINSAEPSGSGLRNIEQAYVSLKPAKAKGFEADFGQFVTSAGAEVIESMTNWNYSHSLLFAYAIPYFHFGLRTSMPVTKTFTAGVQVVNGWNDTVDNNTGKTFGFTGVYTKPKYTLYTNYYVGPENSGTNVGWRNLIDANLVLTPTPKLSAYINYDYGQNRNADKDESGHYTSGSLARWQGIAIAGHYQVTAKSSFSPRFEYYLDPQGFNTGTAQKLNEFTITYEYKMVEGLLARVEFRNDHSNVPFFDKNDNPASSQNQPAVNVGLIAFFGPKR